MKNKFELKGEYIELIKFLKAIGLAETGGHAQQIVMENLVQLNGKLETRKRAKIRNGDVIAVFGEEYEIISQ